MWGPAASLARGRRLGEGPLRAPQFADATLWVSPAHLDLCRAQRKRTVPPGDTHRPAAAVGAHVTVDLEAGWVVCGEDRVNAILLLPAQEHVQTVAGRRP